MTTLEIRESIILYTILFVIVLKKQKKAMGNFNFAEEISPVFLAFIAPVTIVWYGIRAIFFEDWL